MVAGFSDATNVPIAPVIRSSSLCSIKSNFLNLIHQADITVNGKSIEQCQPFINMARHFQLISEMSENDLKTLGHSVGFAPTLDNPRSARCQPTYASTAKASGNGYSNNRTFGSTSDVQTGIPTTSLAFGNAAGQYKIGRYVDLSNYASGIYGGTGLMLGSNLNTEFRPYYTTSGNLMIWHDYGVIKLNYFFESLN